MNIPARHPRSGGFTLPAVLVICAAMLVLAVGLLSLVGIERKTARSFSDSKRAELAARAGMEEFRALLTKETANDDYLVIADLPEQARNANYLPLQSLYLARGSGGDDQVKYRYLPLFSSQSTPDSGPLKAPKADELVGNSYKELATVPGFDPAHVSWITFKDEKDRPVGRYAYWVEDLQGKVDPKVAGNLAGNGGQPTRAAYPFPAAGINPQPLSDTEPRLNQIAVHVLDPDSAEVPSGNLTKNLITNRPIMLSPESAMAAANIPAPLARDKRTGLYVNTLADALDRNVSPAILSYKERPTVPFALGISANAAGQPKKNLNRLLAEGSRDGAIDEFATWIDQGLPKFIQRKGGFPDDYLRTLAANALDYADTDSDGSVKEGVYRGLDSYPLLSEIVMQINYLGQTTENGQRYLKFRNRLFVELWNMTNQPVNGKARFSYELDLHFSAGIGAQPANRTSFDDPSMLSKATHNLTQEGGKFWTPDVNISLLPDQYRFYDVGDITYKISGGDASDTIGKIFSLTENEGGVDNNHQAGRGVAMKWNSLLVDANTKIKHIDTVYADSAAQFQFNIDTAKTVGKAAVPGQSYRGNGTFSNNMGDARAAYYLRNVPLDENSYPGNISPNRRNIRYNTIYKDDGQTKPKFFGRTLPSEWPDGGHDADEGTIVTKTDPKTIPTDAAYGTAPTPNPKTAPQRISNLGRFYSATELGRVYDPLMWTQVYDSTSDNAVFNPPGTTQPLVPASQHWLPEVLVKSNESPNFGGGSTLRIGRPEHPRFDLPGERAANLLDLFHAGESTSEDASLREGDLVTIAGNVNLNTASRDAIRTLAAGILGQDPAIGRVTSWNHNTSSKFAPPVAELDVGTPTRAGDKPQAAARIADAIIKCRPYASAGELTAASETPRIPAVPSNKTDTGAVFGNRKMYNFGDNLQWNDAAAEEAFARVYEASTFRSRNFRIWVIGQALAPSTDGNASEPEVLAEVHKAYTIFADPGVRKADGTIDPSTYHPRVIHENDF